MANLFLHKLNYFLFSKHKKGFSIHSPFLFDLITLVFNDSSDKVAYRKLDLIRKELLQSDKIISVKDFGSGSKKFSSDIRKVSEIAKYSSVRRKYGTLLFNLVAYYKPKTILELGTSLGISTSYLALGNPESRVVSIEGCPETAKIAQETVALAGANNVMIVNGSFEEILPLSFFDLVTLGLVFFDGNHTKEATLNYFEQCLPYITNDSVFVFDDIHWSEDMEEAWETIKKNTKVTLSVDILQFGLVFFHNELSKQDFVIRY
jgi:predicted O-methyltransferase YrrM